MAEQYYEFDDEGPENQGGGHLFLWTVFILLLIGAAFACWLGSFYIFGHPEKPRPYKILKKLKKIEAPKRFEVTMAPPGEFLPAKKLFERFANLKTLELQQENDQLLRNFIKNYKETKKLVPYVTGRFQVLESTALKSSDVFASGVVALAVSEENPQVLLELVFTAAPENVAACLAHLPEGQLLPLERSRDLAAVVHVERTSTGHLQFTAMPIAYGSWRKKNSAEIVSLEPPSELNLEAGFPIVRGAQLQAGLDRFAEKPAAAAEPLVRADVVKPGTPVPETGPMTAPAEAPGATAGVTPSATPSMTPGPLAGGPKVRATPLEVASNLPPPTPRVSPLSTPLPVATPLPRGPGVPLQPFFGTTPQTPAAVSNWKTYSPGKQPAGRVVTPGEAGELAQRGELGGRLYLRGTFTVTASSEGRAVMRAQGNAAETGNARVMVEYPTTIAPPDEGSTFARDETRAFEVRDVRRGSDGQLNIWVRDVTDAR